MNSVLAGWTTFIFIVQNILILFLIISSWRVLQTEYKYRFRVSFYRLINRPFQYNLILVDVKEK